MSTTEGNISERFLQHSKNFDGSVARLPQSFSDSTKKRMVDENTIKGTAITQNIPLDNLVTGILTKYPDQLTSYVQSHGEIPFVNPIKLAVQAVLIRAQDVAKVANQIDTTDEDALREIENGEDAAQDINAPDEFSSLSTEAQAAMKVAMDYMSDCHSEKGGDGTMSSAMYDLSTSISSAQTSSDSASNSADGDFADFSADWYGTTTPTLPGLAQIPIDTGDISPINSMPKITAGPAPSTNTSGIVNAGNSSSGGILGTLGSIFDQISKTAGSVTNAVKNVSNDVNQIGGSINNIGGGIGAASISKYVSDNKRMLIIIGIVLLATIFFAIYLSRKK